MTAVVHINELIPNWENAKTSLQCNGAGFQVEIYLDKPTEIFSLQRPALARDMSCRLDFNFDVEAKEWLHNRGMTAKVRGRMIFCKETTTAIWHPSSVIGVAGPRGP